MASAREMTAMSAIQDRIPDVKDQVEQEAPPKKELTCWSELPVLPFLFRQNRVNELICIIDTFRHD